MNIIKVALSHCCCKTPYSVNRIGL